MKNKYIDLSFLTGWWKASATSAHKEGWHITGWYRSHVGKSICWCITSHPRTPSASTLYTSYQYSWFPSISSYCCPSVAWEACGSWCKQCWWRQTGLYWSQPQDHLGLTIYWSLCLITSDGQISSPSLVCKQNTLWVWVFFLTLLPWEFIYGNLCNCTVLKQGLVVKFAQLT